ncbi:MAG TPA: hypothetical protein VLA37_12845 [Sphingomonadaceae bacterium]|nr:hypothetical protein [Sphingomonadaceae bacterium]
MAQLDALLADIEKTHKEMQAALQDDGGKTARDIVGLRTKFARLVSEMIPAINGDDRLNRNPELKAEFEQKFSEVRQRLAQHQAKYRMASIEDDLAGYRQSVADLAVLQDSFYSWARGALAR